MLQSTAELLKTPLGHQLSVSYMQHILVLRYAGHKIGGWIIHNEFYSKRRAMKPHGEPSLLQFKRL